MVKHPHLQLIVIAAACLASELPCQCADAVAPPRQEELVLENAFYRLEVDRGHGRLLRLLDKEGQIDLKPPAELAESFRLFIPQPDGPRDCVYGKDQTLSRTEALEDALVLHWDGPMTDEQGRTYDLAATMRIELEAQAVVFRFRLTNRTDRIIQEVWCPALGGLLDFGPPDSRAKTVLNPPPHNAKRLARPFGQYLASYPSQNMGFVEVDNPAMDRGMYLGAHDPIGRFKGFYFLESGQSDKSNVTAYLIHYPFKPPGECFEASPFVVRSHKGDWIAGGREIYRPWFAKTFGLMTPDRDWIRRQSFFQMIMIMLPEGNINYTIPEIPQIARDGLKYGVTSLQIAGWQFGGHDNGYPYYEPDPRLGTWDDLKEAIRECHEMGVKIYFFANIHVVNMDTEWYRSELKDYNFETAHGCPSWVDGWGMGTLASRMHLTKPLMSFADVSFPGLADAQLTYFRKLAEIGADGIHIDKCYSQPINFNPRLTMGPDVSPWEGTVRLVDRISRECRAIHTDFRISFETTWDRVLSYGAATWWAGNMSTARRIFPELVETVGLYQPYDYISLNDAVRNGWAVMIGPHHFNRSMDCEPWRGLAAYIRDVKTIRDELSDYVFTGEQLDPGRIDLHWDGDKAPGIEHAVYRNRENGRETCIVTNRGASAVEVTLADLGRAGSVRVYRPAEDPAAQKLPARIRVDAERLVFVVEE